MGTLTYWWKVSSIVLLGNGYFVEGNRQWYEFIVREGKGVTNVKRPVVKSTWLAAKLFTLYFLRNAKVEIFCNDQFIGFPINHNTIYKVHIYFKKDFWYEGI